MPGMDSEAEKLNTPFTQRGANFNVSWHYGMAIYACNNSETCINVTTLLRTIFILLLWIQSWK